MSSVLSWVLINRQLLHQREHEMFAEIQLLRMLFANRPELEGVDDADVNEPPGKAMPGTHGLPAGGVGVVQLIAHIDRAGLEVVMHGQPIETL